MAPDAYRWAFAGQRALYKIYVVTQVNSRDTTTTQNPAADFIRAAIPKLNEAFDVALQEGRKASNITDTSESVKPDAPAKDQAVPAATKQAS